MRISRYLFRLIAIGCAACSLVLLLPAGILLFTQGAAAAKELVLLDSVTAPLLRSTLLMVVCPTICAVLGFVIGAWFADNRLRPGIASGLLLVPLLTGSGVSSFAFKLCFMDVGMISRMLQDRAPIAFWSAEISMLVWEYLPAAIFFAWLMCYQIPNQVREFGQAHRLSFSARLCDIYWFRYRPIFFYIVLVVAAAAGAEYARSALVFRASPGTETEFFSHWLVRAYFTIARVDPNVASAIVVVYTIVFVALAVVVSGGVAILVDRLGRFIWQNIRLGIPTRRSASLCWILLVFTCVFVLAPFIPSVLRGFASVSWGAIGNGLAVVLPSALLLVLSSICFSLAARLGWPSPFGSFGVPTIMASLLVGSAGFLPPIGLAFLGTWWLHFATASLTTTPIVVLWWLLLVIGMLPVFVPGLIATHFGTSQKELAFQERNGASAAEIANWSFFRRYRGFYVLFLTFAVAAMWSEYPISSVFGGLSDKIQSPMLALAVCVEGKSAAFDRGAGILLQMLLPIILATLILGHWVGTKLNRG